MDPAGVVLDSLEKRYPPDTLALSSLSLEAAPGEFLVLLGPSGCGKSTALRIVAGLERATSGSVRIGGRVVDDVEPKDRDVAMVFQSYALYPHLNVRKNIEFPLRARHVPAAERARLVGQAAESLQLGSLLDRKPGQLSGGQRQRVALARAIVRSPVAFLMDEPLSNLDARLRVEMRAELVSLHSRTGTTVLYVTHDQVEAMTMGDRVAILRDGVLQQLGAPRQVHAEPANVFVAGFMGSPPMNLVPGVHLGEEKVIVGLRPEDLEIVREDAPESRLEVTVSLVESLGHENHVLCRLAGKLANGADGSVDKSTEGPLVIVRVPSFAPVPAPGERVGLQITGQVHRFDAVTGERIAA